MVPWGICSHGLLGQTARERHRFIRFAADSGADYLEFAAFRNAEDRLDFSPFKKRDLLRHSPRKFRKIERTVDQIHRRGMKAYLTFGWGILARHGTFNGFRVGQRPVSNAEIARHELPALSEALAKFYLQLAQIVEEHGKKKTWLQSGIEPFTNVHGLQQDRLNAFQRDCYWVWQGGIHVIGGPNGSNRVSHIPAGETAVYHNCNPRLVLFNDLEGRRVGVESDGRGRPYTDQETGRVWPAGVPNIPGVADHQRTRRDVARNFRAAYLQSQASLHRFFTVYILDIPNRPQRLNVDHWPEVFRKLEAAS